MSTIISYEKYDKMCDDMASLDKITWFPTEEEAALMIRTGIENYMSLIAVLSETHEFKDDREKKIMSALNKALIEKVQFVETEKEVPAGRCEITYEAYCSAFAIAKNVTSESFAWFPKMEEIKKIIKPYVKESFALILFLLNSHPGSAYQEQREALKMMVNKNFYIVQKDQIVSLSNEEYEYMVSRTVNSPHKRGNWMPTMEEVKTIIEPNFSRCYDFVYWIIESNKHVNDEDQETYDYLVKLFDQRVVKIMSQSKMEKILPIPVKQKPKVIATF